MPREQTYEKNRTISPTSISLMLSASIHVHTPMHLSVVDGLLVIFLLFIMIIGAVNNQCMILQVKPSVKYSHYGMTFGL
jgi:hypothetical protein